MKAINLVLGLLIMTSAMAQADSVATTTITRYVTHGGCRVYTDRIDIDRQIPGNQTYEIWLYLNKVPSDYNPSVDLAGILSLENNQNARLICQQIYSAYRSKSPLSFVIDLDRSLSNSGRVYILGVLGEQGLPVKTIENFGTGK